MRQARFKRGQMQAARFHREANPGEYRWNTQVTAGGIVEQSRPDLEELGMADVGADLGVMEADTQRMRGDRPYQLCNLKVGDGLDAVVDFLLREGLFQANH